jgi:hypothetical protein
LDLGSLSVTANFEVEGRSAGQELADLAAVESTGVWVLPLSQSLPGLGNGILHVEVADQQGNITRSDRHFVTVETLFADGFESGDTSRWSAVVE